MRRIPLVLTTLLTLVVLVGCGEIDLESRNKSRSLTYQCGPLFKAQAQTADDRRILLYNSKELSAHARRHNRHADEKNIKEAAKNDEYEELEKLLVNYKCTHM